MICSSTRSRCWCKKQIILNGSWWRNTPRKSVLGWLFSDFNVHTIYMDFFASFRNVLSLGASPSAIQDRVNRIVGQSVVGFALCFFWQQSALCVSLSNRKMILFFEIGQTAIRKIPFLSRIFFKNSKFKESVKISRSTFTDRNFKFTF